MRTEQAGNDASGAEAQLTIFRAGEFHEATPEKTEERKSERQAATPNLDKRGRAKQPAEVT